MKTAAETEAGDDDDDEDDDEDEGEDDCLQGVTRYSSVGVLLRPILQNENLFPCSLYFIASM